MIPNKKLVRRTTATHNPASDPPKPNARYAVATHSLPQIDEIDGAGPPSDLNKSLQGRIQRKQSLESSSPSPYATMSVNLFPRSLSVPKVKSKLAQFSKSTIPPKLRPDSASFDQPAKKHKRGVLSLQIDSDTVAAQRKAGLGNKEPGLGGGFYTTQHIAKSVTMLPSKFVRVSKAREKTMPHTGVSTESQASPASVQELEATFLRALDLVPKTDMRALLRVYHRYFSDVIRTSGALASILVRFKEGYEALAEELLDKYNREVAKFQSEIITLQNNILSEVEEKKSFMKKFEKLSRENIDLSHACENYESKCNEYQEKLYDIANTKLDHYPPSQDAYKLLISELENYKSWKNKVLRELKISQSKEKKLVQLVHALKKRGYPVEEVYNSEIRTPAPSSKLSVSRVSEEGESERLVSGPPKERKRPEIVPELNLESVEPDLDSEDEDEDAEYQASEMEFSIRQTISDSSTHTRTEGHDRSDAQRTKKDELKKMSQEFKAFSAALRIGKAVPLD